MQKLLAKWILTVINQLLPQPPQPTSASEPATSAQAEMANEIFMSAASVVARARPSVYSLLPAVTPFSTHTQTHTYVQTKNLYPLAM